MGVSTTGFVLTEKKDVFEVLRIVETVLTELVRKYSKDSVLFRDKTSSVPEIRSVPITRSFYIHFKVNGEQRMLSVYFDCDSDYREYGDSKIIWSVNYWGLAEEIILAVCKAMKQYGKVFYEANDCDGEVVEVYSSEEEKPMQEDRDVQRAETICDFQNKKALLDKQFKEYLKNEGFIFYYSSEETQAYAIHPDYYSAWLKNRKWATYQDWVAVKIDN